MLSITGVDDVGGIETKERLRIGNRHRKGMVGIQTDLQLKKYTVQYRVYVHKKDYDEPPFEVI